MKLYRHYKNKPYRVHGIAKHSETLEELVVYETLYDNPTAKLWVRPRAMFEDNVIVDGREVARFAKVELQLETFIEVGPAQEKVISSLAEKIFGQWNEAWFRGHLRNHPRVHLLIATVDNQAVAFQMGYEIDKETFYSWLGGVHPDYHGLGIAKEMMEAQHAWCRKQGYQTVQAQIQSRRKALIILNLKSGFEIVGSHSLDEGGSQLMLEKKL